MLRSAARTGVVAVRNLLQVDLFAMPAVMLASTLLSMDRLSMVLAEIRPGELALSACQLPPAHARRLRIPPAVRTLPLGAIPVLNRR